MLLISKKNALIQVSPSCVSRTLVGLKIFNEFCNLKLAGV